MRWPHLVLAVHSFLCLAALTWPLYPWVCERVAARPLGLPFPLAWHIYWVLSSFAVLVFSDRALLRGEESRGEDG